MKYTIEISDETNEWILKHPEIHLYRGPEHYIQSLLYKVSHPQELFVPKKVLDETESRDKLINEMNQTLRDRDNDVFPVLPEKEKLISRYDSTEDMKKYNESIRDIWKNGKREDNKDRS